LEQLAETDDDAEGHDHKVISRYLKHFLDNVPQEVENVYKTSKEGPQETAADLEGGTAYMEDDGTTDEPEL
jgi:hypothetical protein